MKREVPIKWSAESWDAFFYQGARHSATRSKDPDRQVGAVLVSPDRRQMSFGYNGFPPGVPDLPSLLADREFKLKNMQHAERNCLLQSPFGPGGCTLYVTRFPCFGCARLIVDKMVTRVVAPRYPSGHQRWGKSWAEAHRHLLDNGVQVTLLDVD